MGRKATHARNSFGTHVYDSHVESAEFVVFSICSGALGRVVQDSTLKGCSFAIVGRRDEEAGSLCRIVIELGGWGCPRRRPRRFARRIFVLCVGGDGPFKCFGRSKWRVTVFDGRRWRSTDI